jgi:ABC-type spermidine/putrescine transport system permease subunit I
MLLILPAIIVILFFACALYLLFATSVHPYLGRGQIGPEWTASNYQKVLGDSLYLSSLGTTFQLSAIATVFAVLLGYPIAYQMVRSDSRLIRSTLIVLVAVPFLTSVVVRLYAMILVLGNSGFVNSMLRSLGIIEERAVLPLVRNEIGVTIGLVYFVLPFVIFTLVTALRRVDASLEEAGQSLGATKTSTFLFITLPLSMPGVVGATMLSFVLCVPAFATPLILGQGAVHMIANRIYDQILFVENLPLGAALAVIALMLTMVLVYLQRWLARVLYRV